MKKYLFLAIIFPLALPVAAQSSADAAVQLQASVQVSPAEITLNWSGNSSTTQYFVYRKLKASNNWGSPVATLAGSVNQYIDNTVSVGTNYEYRVQRQGSNYNGYGYINCGIEVAETDYRGKLLLIVDSVFIDSLAGEINRLVNDIEGDGWEVIRHDVLRTSSVKHVKSLIVSDYNNHPNVTAVFLLGHVPVPYSGNLNPDGHSDHLGAWPADVYYGDIDGIWTDVNVTSTTASPPRTQNVPGDGKFDQYIVPGDVELQVGRVDMWNLSAFAATEIQLLRNYLDKDHEYRKKIFVPLKRAVIDDNFGYFSGEAFAASGYKNFSPLVGTANVTAADYFTSLNAGSYLWSYGCGGGSYTSAGGVGNTSTFASSNVQGVFTMLFGSYFGDWDIMNNFLRAALAQGRILTNMWSGRPHYQLHHMGLGENIGYSLRITQNYSGGLYYGSPTVINGKWVHNALLGDPTLRNDVMTPVSNVIATKVGDDCHITWSASTETNIAGYNIYMKNDSALSFMKLNSVPVAATSYTDPCLQFKGIYTYMVRAVKLENTPSGSYYNMSEGISDTAYNNSSINSIAAFNYSGGPVQFTFSSASALAGSHYWDFGDGQISTQAAPSHTYTSNGTFMVMHVAYHACTSDTAWQSFNITQVSAPELTTNPFALFPNPVHDRLTILTGIPVEIKFYNSVGQMVLEATASEPKAELDAAFLPAGVYFAEVSGGGVRQHTKIIKQ
jgi:hypothetical protein